MTDRARPLAFACGAVACALLAAAAAGGGGNGAQGLGELRAVAVSARPLGRGVEIGSPGTGDAFEVRRVPAEFAPPDAIATPADAAGLRLATALPQGSYLTASDLAPTDGGGGSREHGAPPANTTPVEVAVSAAAALAAGGMRPGALVDVVVAGVPGPGPGAGRTYVAAERVPLLGLARMPAEPGVPERWRATLALTRPAALELIRAESLGRSLRLLAR